MAVKCCVHPSYEKVIQGMIFEFFTPKIALHWVNFLMAKESHLEFVIRSFLTLSEPFETTSGHDIFINTHFLAL